MPAASRLGFAVLWTLLLPAMGRPADAREPAYPRDGARLPIRVEALEATPHVSSDEIRYWFAPRPERGALCRMVIRARGEATEPLELRASFSGQSPETLLAEKEWTWHNAGADGRIPPIGPGMLRVVAFNARRARWTPGQSIEVDFADARGDRRESMTLPIEQPSPSISLVVFPAEANDSIQPKRMLLHLSNDGPSPARLREIAWYVSRPGGFAELGRTETFEAFPDGGVVPGGDRGGAYVPTGPLPLAQGLVEAVLESPDGQRLSQWAQVRFKLDRFDIGSGWLDVPSKPGVVPLTRERFHLLLRRMHVNCAHIDRVPGYTDSVGPDGLWTRFPLRKMSELRNIEENSRDEAVRWIHGVDALGEPQMDKTPMQALEALRRYDAARYPTTITLSKDSGFKDFAGLSDFPHFDAYRVAAPAADAWPRYDRWGEARLRWGAPLEGIGSMTRTLRALSRPRPIAAWSQNVHEGWGVYGGRRRRSPTPDEILVQAYHALASGIHSLYWYSLQSWSLLAYRDAIDVTTRIGRTIRAVEDLLVEADFAGHERVTRGGRPSLDLSVLAGPRAGLLFMIELEYEPDLDEKVFRFAGPRDVAAAFSLPGHLRSAKDVFRVDAEGVHSVPWSATRGGVRVEIALDRAAVFVVTHDPSLREQLGRRLRDLEAKEQATGLDPASSERDFLLLARDLGFENLAEAEALARPKAR